MGLEGNSAPDQRGHQRSIRKAAAPPAGKQGYFQWHKDEIISQVRPSTFHLGLDGAPRKLPGANPYQTRSRHEAPCWLVLFAVVPMAEKLQL